MPGIKAPQDYWLRKWNKQKRITIVLSMVGFVLGLVTYGVIVNVWNSSRWCQ